MEKNNHLEVVAEITKCAEHILEKEILNINDINKLGHQIDEFIKHAKETKVYFKRLL